MQSGREGTALAVASAAGLVVAMLLWPGDASRTARRPAPPGPSVRTGVRPSPPPLAAAPVCPPDGDDAPAPVRDDDDGTIAVAPAEPTRSPLPSDEPARQPPRPVELSGELEVVVACDLEGRRAERRHRLITPEESYPLRFVGAPPALAPGARVRVRGTLRDGCVTVEQTDRGELPIEDDGAEAALAGADGDPGPGVVVLRPRDADTEGEQRVLVILARFADSRGLDAVTPDEVRARVFSEDDPLSANRYYQECSHGKVRLAGTVAGWYTLPIATGADTDDIFREAARAAESDPARSIAIADYPRVVIIFPKHSGSVTGLGTIGKSSKRTDTGTHRISVAWIAAPFSQRTLWHELGHNFGFGHANAWRCAGGGCGTVEYDGPFSPMGHGEGHPSAFHKEVAGWLPTSLVPDVTGQSGVYEIEPLGRQPTRIGAIKIRRSARSWYYVDYRTRTGIEEAALRAARTPAGASITIATFDDLKTHSVDTTPGSRAPDADWDDAPLVPGARWEDPEIGLRITTLSASADRLVVEVRTAGARFEASPRFARAPATVAFDGGASTDMAGGAIVSWRWDFGDGATGTGRTVQHRYAQPGVHRVTLTVTSDASPAESFTTTGTVSIASSTTAADVDGDGAVDRADLDLLDAYLARTTSLSLERRRRAEVSGDGVIDALDRELVAAHLAGTVDRLPLRYGDFDLSGRITAQDYYDTRDVPVGRVGVRIDAASLQAADVYHDGVVNARDVDTLLDWFYRRIARIPVVPSGAPQPALTALPARGTAPLTVRFNGSGSIDPDGRVAAWEWDTGDGVRRAGIATSHTYDRPGTYTASLVVRDDGGRASAPATVEITVLEPGAPVARIDADVAQGAAPLAVRLDGGGSTDADGRVVAWRWELGDGTSATGRTVSHTFAAPGDYEVRLVVTDDAGRSSEAALASITVVARPGTVLPGDANLDGRVDSADAELIEEHLAGRTALGPVALGAADVTLNGTVNDKDAYEIRRHVWGYQPRLPARFGDLDRDDRVTSADVALLDRAFRGTVRLASWQLHLADADGSRRIDWRDRTLIDELARGRRAGLPVDPP